MRRHMAVRLAALLAVTCVVTGSSRVAAQAPPEPAAAAPLVSDLGAAWRPLFQKRIADGEGYSAAYVNPETNEFLAITILASATRQSPENLIADSLEGLRRGQPNPMLDVVPIDPPPLGQDAMRRRAGVTDDEDALTSDLIAWRTESLVVLVVLLGEDGVDALPYAEWQDAKITALATGSAVPSRSASIMVVSVTSARPGGTASVTVETPAGAVCSIEFRGPEGTRVAAPGLELPMADGARRVTWTWLVPPGTAPGAGSLQITCDGAVIVVPIQVL